MTDLLSSGDLALILADGGALVVEDAGTGASVTLRAYRGRRDFDLGGDEAIGLRSVGDTGYALVRREVTRSGDFFWEETFTLTQDGDEAVAARPARLDAFDLAALETLYGADLNGDGFTGFALLAEIVAPVAGGPSVHQVTTGAFAIVDGGEPVVIVSDRGAPWAPGHDESVVGVRADAGGYTLMLAKRGRGDDISFRELSVSPEGVTSGRSAAVDDVMLLDKEADYGRDFDGDGIAGRVVAEESAQLALNTADDLAVFRQPSGLMSVVADPANSDAMVPLVNDAGLPWTPGDNTVYAVRAEGAGVAVLARGEGGDFEYVFAPSGGNLEATGRPLSIDARELALREVAYDLDLNGSGVVGEPVVARRDISVRADGHELELYETEAGSHFFKLGDRVCATRIEGGETALPPFAPNFPFSEESDGIVLRASRGQLWDARYDGSNGEAVAIKATAVNADLRPTAVTVLIRTESETGIVRFYEQDHALDAASNETLAETARWRLTDPKSVEGLYLQDLDLDRVIDARTVDFATDFPISPTGAYLAEERLIVTGEQVRYLSGGPDACGVRAVPADHRFPDYYDAGEDLIDRGFRLTPADQVDERDTLSVSLRSAGGVATFGFTVPDHALQEETHVRVAPATLSPGAVVEIVNSDGVVVSGDAFLESGADLAGGVYFLRVDTSNAEAQPFALELVQRPPLGWVRAVTARENVLEIDQPVIDVDTDLGDVDPDLVTMEFNPGSGGTVVVTAGTELRILAEHAAGKTFIGDGTVALLGDLRGHDFSSVLTATVDFSEADHIDHPDGGAELNFPLDVNLWPPIEAGKLWIIRGDQADLVTRTEGLRIEGSKEGGSVGNARIVDSVAGLDLSDVDVAYIDMSGATGTPTELPQVDSGRFVLLRADQATGLGGDFGGARLHLTSDSLTHIAENAVDYSAIKLAGGQFTTVVRADLSVDANADLGELRVTVLGANTTLRLTAEQASARQINDRVAIWTRDTDRSSQQTGAAGGVVVTEADNTTDFSRFGENNISAQNDHLYVTLEFRESGVVDLGANATITSPIGALLRGTGTELPPALRIDAYDVGPGVTLRLGEEQATFREASGAGRIKIADFGSATDAWGFQRGSSPTVEATLISGEGMLDLRTNRSLDDAVDEYTLGARATSFAEAQATGRLIEGDAGVDVEVYDLQDDTDLSKIQTHLNLTVYQTSDRDISANSNLATVDLFDMSSHTLEASSSLLGNDVIFENGNVTLTVNEDEILLKEFDLTDASSMVELATGSDISGATLTGVDVYSLVDGASVTMSVAQHDVQDVMIDGGGSETITLVGSADSDADTDIETYVLDGSHDNVLRLSAGGQSVTGGAGDDTVDVGGLIVTGTYALAGGANVVRVDDGANVSQAEVSATGGTFVFDLLSDATATMSTTQHIAAAGITGEGPNAITFSNGGTVTGDADIETYTLANVGANTFTLGSNGQSVRESGGANTLVFGSDAYNGTFTGFGANDTYRVVDGTNLSGATGLDAGALDFQDASATLTLNAAQNGSLTILVDGADAGAQTIIVSEADTFTADANVEAYRLTGVSQITVAAGTAVSVDGADSVDQTVVVNGLTTTGAYDLGGGTDDTVSITAESDIRASAFTEVERVTLASGVNATMTIAQNALIALAEGTNTVTLSDVGTATGDAEVEAYVLANGANTFTLGALGQNVTDSGGANTLVFGSGAYNGTFTGFGAEDTYRVVGGTNLSGATSLDLGELDFNDASATVTLDAAQNASLTILAGGADAGAQTIALTEAATFTGNAAIEAYILGNGDQTFTVGAAGQAVTTGSGTVTVSTAVVTGALDGSSADSFTLAVTGGTLDFTGVTLTGLDALTIANGATVTLTAAQASGVSITGDGKVIVTDVTADTNLTNATVETLEVQLSGAADLRTNATLGGVDRYDLTGDHMFLTLLGTQATGKQIDATSGNAGTRAELWLVGLPGDADLSGVDVRGTIVSLTENVDIADGASINTISTLVLGASTLTAPAGKLPAGTVQFGNGGEVFWSTFYTPANFTEGAVLIRGVQDATDLASFVKNPAFYGAPPVTARINESETVNLSANATLTYVAAYEVGTGATLTVTAAQADGDTATGAGAMVIAGLDGSAADLSLIEPSGGVTLALGAANATLAAGFDFADIAYTVTSDGAAALDIRNLDTVPATASFALGADVTLTLWVTQANGQTVMGTGDVVVDGITTLTGIVLSNIDDLVGLTLQGTEGGDTIDASAFTRAVSIDGGDGGDDTLTGGAGSDNLTGGAGNDTFVFKGAAIGSDVIIGFEGAGAADGDVIDVSSYGVGIDAFDDLIVTESVGDTVITSSAFSGSMTLQGVTGLNADDFVFGSPT